MDPIYQAIEIAVKATGAQAVNDLKANVALLESQIDGLRVHLKAGTIGTIEATTEMAKLQAQLNQAKDAAAAAGRVLAGLPAQMRSTESATRGASVAMIEFSRGIEDLATGGFLGILNNIPGMARGIGQAFKLAAPQVAAAETAISLFATGAYLAYQNWPRIQQALNAGIGPKVVEDLKFVTDRLKELDNKQFKTSVDYQDIKNLKEEIRLLTEAEQAYNRAKGHKTEDEEEAAKVLTEGIGSDADKVARAVVASTAKVDSVQTIAARKQLEEMQALLKEQMSSSLPHVLAQVPITTIRAGLAGTAYEAAKGADKEARDKAADELVGKALTGRDEAARAGLQGLIEKDPDKFKSVGVDVGKVGQSLRDASPEGIANRKRIDAEYEQAIKDTDYSIDQIKDRFDAIRKEEKARGRKDAEVAAAELKAQMDTEAQTAKDARARGAGAKRDEAAEMQAMKNIARSNERRSKDQQPGSTVSAQLQTQALMEKTLGIVGPATQQIEQIMRNNQLLAMKVQAITQAVNRGRPMFPTRSPNGPGR